MPSFFPSGTAYKWSWCLALMLGTAAPCVFAADPVQDGANNPTMRFDLPSQPLADSLVAFGRMTGYSILVSSQLTAQRMSPPVAGDMSAGEALLRLLMGTQLIARYVGPRAVTLAPISGDPMEAATPEPLAGVAVNEGERVARSNFAGSLQASITRRLCERQPKQFGRYRAVIQLWIDGGIVRRTQLLGSSGTNALGSAISSHLTGLVLSESEPQSVGQPLTIVLNPRTNPAAECRQLGVLVDQDR